MRLLIVEDDAELAELLAKGFQTARCANDVLFTAGDARAALATIRYAAVRPAGRGSDFRSSSGSSMRAGERFRSGTGTAGVRSFRSALSWPNDLGLAEDTVLIGPVSIPIFQITGKKTGKIGELVLEWRRYRQQTQHPYGFLAKCVVIINRERFWRNRETVSK